MLHGTKTPESEFTGRRVAIAEPTVTMTGHIALRVAREYPGCWSQSEIVVLTADEAETLKEELGEIVRVARLMERYAA